MNRALIAANYVLRIFANAPLSGVGSSLITTIIALGISMTAENELFNTADLASSPLNEFSGCHEHIVVNFKNLQKLVNLLREQPDAPDIKPLAGDLLRFFKQVVLGHHAEEEQELFVAVMDCAEKGEEAGIARQSIKRLVAEHRELERMWARLQPELKRLSRGKDASLDIQLADDLATQYLAHAAYEEQFFLPLSAKILSKNEMSALGLALHMRHQDEDYSGNYI